MRDSCINYVIGILFFFFAGGTILITGNVESSILAKVLWAGIYALAGLLGFFFSRSLLATVQRSPGFMMLASLCFASIFWTSNQSTTLSYSIGIFGATLVSYLMATKVEPLHLFQLAAHALFAILLINMVLMLPNISGNLGSGIRYAGIFTQPNVLGRVASLGVLLFVVLTLSGAYPKVLGGIGVGMGGVLILACNSMTSFLAASFAIGLFVLRKLIGRPVGTGHIAIVAWFMFFVGGLLWLNWSAIIDFSFGLMGRSPSLTGRTELWTGVWNAILKKPVLGYGYSGFWSGERLLSEQILLAAGWTTASAHNGLYDIALHLGFVGVFMFVVIIGRTFLNALKYSFGTNSEVALVVLSLLSYLIILGATESVYMMRNSINWVLFVLCVIYMKRIQDECGFDLGRVEDEVQAA